MTTITVSVKYSNRTYRRYYSVSADLDFIALKDEIKATAGARFFPDGLVAPAAWHISAEALKQLKQKYSVEPCDVNCDLAHTSIYFIKEFLCDYAEGLVKKLQDAYNKSDLDFVQTALAHNARLIRASVILEMLREHKNDPRAQEIIERERNKT